MSEERTTEHELDLALAAELQAALLPKDCPPGYAHHRAAARNRMYGSVGGDFYDFIRVNSDQIAIVIGDVVGHGIRASLMMAQIMGFLRSRPADLPRPVRMIGGLNRMLMGLGDRIGSVLPCSLFYGVFDAPSGLALFVNAGHPRPYLCDRRAGSVVQLGSHDLLLGVEEYEPTEMCYSFVPGERLTLFTDGIIDAVNAQEEHFGPERLVSLIERHAGDEPDVLAAAVIGAVDDFRRDAAQTDDESIVVVDRV